jgi:hypothetical protein
MGFFKLCGRTILECCSICGAHAEVLLCDGIAGLACANGGRQKGGLAGSCAAQLRPFTAPSQDARGVNVVKLREPGVNYNAAALGGGGLKRRLVHQPELRALIARFSQHHADDPNLGSKLSNVEFDELLAALDRDDVQVAPEFVPNPVDEEGDPVLFHKRRRLLHDQFGQIRSKNRAMLALLRGMIQTEALRASPLRPPRCPAKWAELLYGFGTPQSVSDDSNLIQHQRAVAVVRKLLPGGVANLDDQAIFAEHAPILGRLLDHFGFVFLRYFTPALHHLYRLTLFGRGAVGLGVGRAGWPLSAIEGLDYCVWTARNFVEHPWTRTADRLQAVQFWETRANALLPGVESLTAPSTALYPMNVPETELLNERLGLNPDGEPCGALPLEHSFCKEQRVIGCYPLPGWE